MPLTLVRSNFTVTIQYSTSGYSIQQQYPESYTQLILLLTISLRIHTYFYLFFITVGLYHQTLFREPPEIHLYHVVLRQTSFTYASGDLRSLSGIGLRDP